MLRSVAAIAAVALLSGSVGIGEARPAQASAAPAASDARITLVGPSGRPAPTSFEGFTVALADQDTDTYLADRPVDASGQVTFAQLPPGHYSIAVYSANTADGYIGGQYTGGTTLGDAPDGTSEPATVLIGSGAVEKTLTLRVGATASGRLTDDAGLPVSGVGVNVASGEGVSVDDAITDADGRWSLVGIDGLPTGLIFTPPEGSNLISGCYNGAGRPLSAGCNGGETIDFAAGQNFPGLDAVVSRGGSVSGRLTSDSGTGVVGMELTAQTGCDGSGSLCYSRTTTTGANGAFVFNGLEAGTYSYTITPTSTLRYQVGGAVRSDGIAGGSTSSTSDRLTTPVSRTSAATGVSIVSPRGGAVGGAVRGTKSYVSISVTDGTHTVWTSVDPGASTYLIPGVPTGTYTLTASAQNAGSPTSRVVVSTGATSTQDVDFGQGATISGRVSVGGRTTASGSVTLQPSGGGMTVSSAVASDGTYSIVNVAPGTYSLVATAPGGQATQKTVTVGATALSIDIDLPLGQKVDVKVAGPGGTPISGALVSLFGGSDGDSGTTGSDGIAHLVSLGPGAHTLFVSKQAYSFGSTQTFDVDSDNATTQTLTVRGTAAAQFTLVLTSETGAPVRGQSVTVRDADGNLTGRTTDVNGRAGFDVAAGHYLVAPASGVGFPGTQRKEIDVSPGINADVALPLDSTRRIDGEILNPTGSVSVRVAPHGDADVSHVAQIPTTNGSFTIPFLVDGVYDVTATSNGTQSRTQTVTIAAATPSARLTFDFSKGTATATAKLSIDHPIRARGGSNSATIRVTGGSETPSGQVTFRIDGTSTRTVTLRAGSATLDLSTLTPGTHTVSADYEGDSVYTASSASVSVDVRDLYVTIYDGVIYAVDDSGTRTPLSPQQWRDEYRFAAPVPARTDWVRYSWSGSLYAVTFWQNDPSTWLWHRLSYSEWQRAGFPAARPIPLIAGSTVYQWSTSPELFLQGEDGGVHKLSYAEWRDAGFPRYTTRAGGFKKLTWSGEIGMIDDGAPGGLAKVDYAQWSGYGFPTPALSSRFSGDIFYSNPGSPTIWYAGPLVNRPITFAEWQAAGAPPPMQVGVTAGAFCSPAGATGQTSTGRAVRCGPSTAEPSVNRWRSV